ncbi:MAG TPA: hypothetical protein VHB46_01885 [Burkholderiales bacterium]|nr:hypothetical protein [Burkholderiales bacterium]
MTDTLLNLDSVDSGYTVFEKDQVLTPEQLNGLSGYLDDQDRLTRIGLIGVGIACGLWASLEKDGVHLSRGVGTTTDGDLVLLAQAGVYDRFKAYDTTAPKYAPFYRNGNMIAAYELVAAGVEDERALPLARLADEDRDPGAMAALLLVESHLHDPDLCAGEDCDNRGMNAMHTLRVLLVDAASAAFLAQRLDTPDRAFRTPLTPVVAQRPVLTGAIDTEAELADLYRKACEGIHADLLVAFDALYAPCRTLVADFAPSDPAPQWRKALEQIRKAAPNRGIQYYYDFLKDLAETHASLLDILAGDDTLCCPDVAAFPKHLVLGALQPALRAAIARTRFYPSPAVSPTQGRRSHARFLFRKIDTLIATFAVPAQPADIRITPSRFEDCNLEGRAIPYYYGAPQNVPPVHLAWSHEMARKGMELYQYSYNAPRYGALGAAANPSVRQVGRFDFFRIEGHLGWDVTKAAATLRAQIRAQNLPVDVETVLIGTDRGRVIFDPPLRNLDLYRWQHLMKAEVTTKLQDAVDYSRKFTSQVAKAVGDKVIASDDLKESVDIPGYATNQSDAIALNAQKATEKLLKADYDMNSNWQDDVLNVATVAAGLRKKFSPVTKMEFVSPLDNLVAQPERWLGWVDGLIKDGEDKAADRLMLSNYLAQHPGLEHFGGVMRGGTFVLVYDTSNTVIADFMLPYNCCVTRNEPIKLPPLVIPPRPVKPELDLPISLVALPDKFRFVQFQDQFKKDINVDLDKYRNYFNVYKDIVGTVGDIKGTVTTTFPGKDAVAGIDDAVLGNYVAETKGLEDKVDRLNNTLLRTDLKAEDRLSLEKDLDDAQQQLGASVVKTMDHLASTNQDVKAGTQGALVVQATAASLGKVNNVNALADVEKGLNGISGKATTAADTRSAIGNILAVRGMM